MPFMLECAIEKNDRALRKYKNISPAIWDGKNRRRQRGTDGSWATIVLEARAGRLLHARGQRMPGQGRRPAFLGYGQSIARCAPGMRRRRRMGAGFPRPHPSRSPCICHACLIDGYDAIDVVGPSDAAVLGALFQGANLRQVIQIDPQRHRRDPQFLLHLG